MAGALRGERVSLETVDIDKIDLVNQWFNDPLITKNLNVGVLPMSKDKTRDFLVRAQTPTATDRVFSINALDLPEGEEAYIGHIALHRIRSIDRTAELGIVIGMRQHLNKGYGTEAIKVLLDFAFREMNLNRVSLTYKDFNLRGQKAYQKAGFQEEGRLREQVYNNGRYWDMVIMGILKKEYLAEKIT